MVKPDFILKNIDMSKYSCYKTGGIALYGALPTTEFELVETLEFAKHKKLDYYIVGDGSNILFSDDIFYGVVIILKDFDQRIVPAKNAFYAGAGVKLDDAVLYSISNSYLGMESLSGIPGTVGGAAMMNAGAFGTEIKDICLRIRVLDKSSFRVSELNIEDINYSYRDGGELKDKIVLGVLFGFLKTSIVNNQNDDILLKKRERVLQQRALKQPLDYPSCGSVFKRPKGHYVGALIEESGLKGFELGGAKVSEKHANFILNFNNATAKNIYELIGYIQKKVFDNSGVLLETEIQLIGFK